jgi:hypothetical protein
MSRRAAGPQRAQPASCETRPGGTPRARRPPSRWKARPAHIYDPAKNLKLNTHPPPKICNPGKAVHAFCP